MTAVMVTPYMLDTKPLYHLWRLLGGYKLPRGRHACPRHLPDAMCSSKMHVLCQARVWAAHLSGGPAGLQPQEKAEREAAVEH